MYRPKLLGKRFRVADFEIAAMNGKVFTVSEVIVSKKHDAVVAVGVHEQDKHMAEKLFNHNITQLNKTVDDASERQSQVNKLTRERDSQIESARHTFPVHQVNAWVEALRQEELSFGSKKTGAAIPGVNLKPRHVRDNPTGELVAIQGLKSSPCVHAPSHGFCHHKKRARCLRLFDISFLYWRRYEGRLGFIVAWGKDPPKSGSGKAKRGGGGNQWVDLRLAGGHPVRLGGRHGIGTGSKERIKIIGPSINPELRVHDVLAEMPPRPPANAFRLRIKVHGRNATIYKSSALETRVVYGDKFDDGLGTVEAQNMSLAEVDEHEQRGEIVWLTHHETNNKTSPSDAISALNTMIQTVSLPTQAHLYTQKGFFYQTRRAVIAPTRRASLAPARRCDRNDRTSELAQHRRSSRRPRRRRATSRRARARPRPRRA